MFYSLPFHPSFMFRRVLGQGEELVSLDEQHAEEMFRLIDRNREHLRPWMPWLDNTRTVDDSEEFIHNSRVAQAKGEGLVAGIFAGGKLVGLTSFVRVETANRSALIGYWIGEEHQGKGLVTRACAALIDYGFEELGLNRIVIRAATDNRRSQAVPLRLGFAREGVERQAEWVNDRFVDLVVFSLLRGEWRGQP
jgi:ribosomal-protein-serine acetyltransferase